MSFSAELDTAKLSIALDLRQPLAFLALAPAIAFGRELGLAIDWLPFAAEPLRAPTTPRSGDDRAVRHRRHRAHMVAREIAVYAEAQGLTLQQPYRAGDPDGAHLAWLWMRARARDGLPAFLSELFRRYWALELDAADPRAAAEVVEVCGGDAVSFLSWAETEGPATLEQVASDLQAAGVFGVPAYRLGDQLFLGRQHLPMIRWLHEGGTGRGPI